MTFFNLKLLLIFNFLKHWSQRFPCVRAWMFMYIIVLISTVINVFFTEAKISHRLKVTGGLLSL